MGLVSTTVLEHESLLRQFHVCGMEKLVDDTSSVLEGKQKVFLDGEWVGMCKDSKSFVAKLRRTRRKMEMPYQVEIKIDVRHGEVRVFSDAGRILQPLLLVQKIKKIKDLKGEFSFQSLLDNGIVEFIGAEEEEDCRTDWGIKYLFSADNEKPLVKYTLCELDCSFLLGLSCGLIPFANHDHARRVLYQSETHSQQAIGFSTTNPSIRVDTNSHNLYYPQRPIFRTMLSDSLGKSKYSSHHKGMLPHPEFFNGQCAIVAVNVHLGYNLERGMFRTEHVRSYKAEVDTSDAPGKKLKPDDLIDFGKIESKIGHVDSLDDDGFPFIRANLQTGDSVIGKHAGVDHSIKLKHTERGMVQKVVLPSNDDRNNFAAVSLRQVRNSSRVMVNIFWATLMLAMIPVISSSSQPRTEYGDIKQRQLFGILDTLYGLDFMIWRNLLSTIDPSILPPTATFFLPSDDRVGYMSEAQLDPLLIPYHIVSIRLLLSDLHRLSIGTRLPTLVSSKYIVISSNSGNSLSVNDISITHPNVYSNSIFAVHGIARIMNYSAFGGGDELTALPWVKPTLPTPEWTPKKGDAEYRGDITLGTGVSSICLQFSIFVMVLLVFLFPRFRIY